jgi:hypothetical protein
LGRVAPGCLLKGRKKHEVIMQANLICNECIDKGTPRCSTCKFGQSKYEPKDKNQFDPAWIRKAKEMENVYQYPLKNICPHCGKDTAIKGVL